MQLVIDDVGKLYKGNVWGVRHFNLELRQGILGLLGPNGAGKSTLMRMMATITQPTEGRILWNGTDVRKSPDVLRTVLGYLPQDFGVYPHLNAVEFLQYMAALKGLDGRSVRQRIDQLLTLVNLADVRKRPLGGYSGGMRQRIGIAQALLNDPQLLIVDEPTVGLDPEERVRFRNLLSDLSGQRIVILSTHIVPDVEAVATDIAIMNKGQLLVFSTPETLVKTVEGKVWELDIPNNDVSRLRDHYTVSTSVRRGDWTRMRIVSDTVPTAPNRSQAVSPSLEDTYLYYALARKAGTV